MKLSWQEIETAVKGERLAGDPAACVESYAQDSRKALPGDLFFPIRGPHRDGHDFLPEVVEKGVRAFLISREDAWTLLTNAVPEEELMVIRVEDTLEALKDLARYVQSKVEMKIVGVTGSTGKTSTRDMTACVLRSAYKVGATEGNLNTEIGMSLTLLGFPEDTEVAVLEMGMDHAGEIAALVDIAPPYVGLITNIGLSHVENLGSREEIYRAKMEITSRMEPQDVLMITQGRDFLTRERIEADYGVDRFRLRITGEDPGCDLWIEDLVEEGADGVRFQLTDREGSRQDFHLPVPGRHNARNAALAVGAGLALGIPMEDAARALEELEITGGRLKAEEAGGCLLLNDTYNASPDSAKAAIDVLMSIAGGKHYAVLLDMLELGAEAEEEHRKLGEYARQQGVDRVLTWGELSSHTVEGAGEIGRHFKEKEDVTETLLAMLEPGDAVLFKGSRGMRAETILEEVRRRLSEQ